MPKWLNRRLRSISRASRALLKLTPAQEPYWAPVEAALRDLSRRQAQSEGDGLVRRISHRVVSIVLNSAAVHGSRLPRGR